MNPDVTMSEAEIKQREARRRKGIMQRAAQAFAKGERDWDALTGWMNPDWQPGFLSEVWAELPRDQQIKAVGDAWTMCHWPEELMPRQKWLPIFRAVGYHDNLRSAMAPDSVILWRGGTNEMRMAWTGDRDRAVWFQHRLDDEGTPGKLWTITVGADRLLAHYNNEKGRAEDEYVIDPSQICPKEIR